MTTETLMGGTTPDTAPAAPAAETVPATAPDGQPAPAAEAPAAAPAAAPEGDKPAEEKAEEKPAGAPEKYELKAPEGAELHAEVQGQFEEVARELNLTQEQAQKLVEVMQPKLQATQQAQIEAVKEQWKKEARADKEFGGEKFDENLSTAKKGYDALATPELKTLLESSGLGNHPEVIRLFHRVGQKLSSSHFVQGGAPAGKRSAAEVMYPNHPQS